MLNPKVIHKIQLKWGPPEVDMLASRLTTQLKRFFSWRPDSEAEALDASVRTGAAYREGATVNSGYNRY